MLCSKIKLNGINVMNLKNKILENFSKNKLQTLCVEFKIKADQRSQEKMRQAITHSTYIDTSQLMAYLELAQIKSILDETGQPSNGGKKSLIDRLIDFDTLSNNKSSITKELTVN
jgi:predicted homoserine dehydrogenase-like protein